ncbi:MAG: 50S ribosomal protein L4 [Bdellovibrionales bacterium]|jgi:large subunit ribosomal protein L4|nr:50S ribosomal protein L4 [Bdellovibrionales bacterium]
MATIAVYNWEKKKVGDVELPGGVFEQPVRKDLLHTVVRWQLACRRQGNASTKTKGLVSGGGKKPFKQKGTGGARQGSSRSPLMPGGGTAFGPQTRSYAYSLPKKVRQAGLRSALSFLAKEGRLHVVEDMKSEGKTNELAKKLANFGLEKAVLLDGSTDALMARAARNLPKFRYYGTEGLNVYDLLKFNNAVLSKGAIQKIVERCGLEG